MIYSFSEALEQLKINNLQWFIPWSRYNRKMISLVRHWIQNSCGKNEAFKFQMPIWDFTLHISHLFFRLSHLTFKISHQARDIQIWKPEFKNTKLRSHYVCLFGSLKVGWSRSGKDMMSFITNRIQNHETK